MNISKDNIHNIYDSYGLTPSRAAHSLGVADIAMSLAAIHNGSEEDAWIAGALHDLARDWPDQKLSDFSKAHGISLNNDEIRDPILIHGKVAANICESDLSINKEDVLAAITSHTSGHADMSVLEEIIYVADFLESTQGITEYQSIRDESTKNIRKTVALVNQRAKDYIQGLQKKLSQDFLENEQYYRQYLE